MASGDSLIMEVDVRRIEAEAEKQNLGWEIGIYRVLAVLLTLTFCMVGIIGSTIGWSLALPLMVYAAALAIHFVLGTHVLRRGFHLPTVRWVNATFEGLFATLALLIIARFRGAAWAAATPATLVYPVALIASCIRMSTMLTVYTTGVSIVGYLITYFAVIKPGLSRELLATVPTFGVWAAFERAFWIAMIGGVAAYAARKIRQTAVSSRAQAAEKRRLAEELGRFVSEEVSSELLRGRVGLGHAERREVTVLFCDVRDFTALCERAEPELVLALLNSFYERACRIIQAHGGHVNKFLGDGVLAIFGAPDPHPRHAQAAAEAALQLCTCADELRAQGGIWEHMKIGVGLDTGFVVMGAVGSTDRMEYTAIGSTVNRAARLQALSVGGRRVVVSERCAVNVGRTKPELVPLGEVLIKGVPAPTRIYTFRAPSQPGLPIGATNVSSAEMSPSTPLTPTGRS